MDVKEVKKAWDSYERYMVETRYAVRDPETGEPLEHGYDDVINRAASELRKREKVVRKNSVDSDDLDHLISALRGRYVIPVTPFLMSFGNPHTRRHGYFSCFPLGHVEDSMEGIRRMCEKMEAIYVRGGGCGIDISRLRPKGALVDNGQGLASGPVGFLAKFDAVTGTTNQGGRRRGALLVQMDWNHPDIERFVKAKASAAKVAAFLETLPPEERPEQNPVLSNMNISVNVFGDFWENEKLLDLIARQMWETGDPGLLFTDNMAKWSPFRGEDNPRFSNPCLVGNTLVVDVEPDGPSLWRIEDAAKGTPRGMKAWQTGKKEVFRIRLVNGAQIEATFDHMFLTAYGWRPVCDLKPGTPILTNTVDRTLAFWLAKQLSEGVSVDPEDALNALRDLPGESYLPPEKLRWLALYFACVFRKEDRLPAAYLSSDFMFVLSSLTGIQIALRERHYEITDTGRFVLENLFAGNPVPAVSPQTVEVAWIEPAGDKDVYDFTMLDGRPYSIANGVVVHNCGEYLAPANTACNLITVNAAKVAYECWDPATGEFNFRKFFERMAFYADLACFLGNILIDCDDGYPLEEIRRETRRIRPVGVGMTGFHTALVLAYDGKHRYGSGAALKFAEFTQLALTLGSLRRSACLARKQGKAHYRWNPDYLKLHLEEIEETTAELEGKYPGSALPEIAKEVIECGKTLGGFYNACTTSQPPTGSVSVFARVGGDTGIEPMFAVELTRRVRDFEKGWVTVEVVTEPLAMALAARPEVKKRVEASLAHVISPESQLEMLGVFQKFVHTGVSKTVNVPEGTTVEEIKDLIFRARDLRLKGFTVFRSGSRPDAVYLAEKKDPCPGCGGLSLVRNGGCKACRKCGYSTC